MNVMIRDVAMNDLPFVQQYCSLREISKTTSIPHPYPQDGAVQWFEFVSKSRKEGKIYAFTILREKNFAGIISVKQKEVGMGLFRY